MKNRFITAILAAVCAVALPLAANATTYTLKIPIQLVNLPFSSGTLVSLSCYLFASSKLFQQLPGNVNTWPSAYANLALNSSGSLSTTASLSITEPPTAAPQKSYVCAMAIGNPAQAWQPGPGMTSLPDCTPSLITQGPCVSGTIP
jgi:hypothetical protein